MVERPITETRRQRKARIASMAAADWNAIASEVDPRIHAKRHLAEMNPQRRAELEKEWNDDR